MRFFPRYLEILIAIFQIRRNLSHFSISGLSTYNNLKSRGWTLYSQEPTNLSQIFLDEMFPRSIDKDLTFISTHQQRNSSPRTSGGNFFTRLRENSFRKRCFITKVATASTVDDKLILIGVADRSLSTANFVISLGLPTWMHWVSCPITVTPPPSFVVSLEIGFKPSIRLIDLIKKPTSKQ